MGRVLIAAMVATLAACSSRTDTETFGNFRIETWRSEAFGHSGHSFKVFHLHNGSRAHEIADNVEYFLDPNGPDRILVRGCLDIAKEDTCALRYFDGATDQTHVISIDHALQNGQRHWSPDGSFLAVAGQLGLLVTDLDTGNVFDAAAALDLHLPERGIDMFQLEWSPDSAMAAVWISNRSSTPPNDVDYDLLEIDAAASSIRYVASRPWQPVTDKWFEWQTNGGRYSLAASADPYVFRKPRYQIPSGIGY